MDNGQLKTQVQAKQAEIQGQIIINRNIAKGKKKKASKENGEQKNKKGANALTGREE